MPIIGATNPGTDHHSGYYYIPVGLTVVVALNKQMTSWDLLSIDGELLIEGQLISEIMP